MNHIYRLVWNSARHMLVAVAENAGNCSKGGTPRQRRSRKPIFKLAAMAGALVLGLMPGTALSLPTGGQVAAGGASISQSSNTLTVTQTTNKAILNWQSFGISSGETVNFVQPGASSVALNRVLGSDASAIYGNLNANGQVFLVNPNGVYFAPGAQVNVGGLIASTLDISDSDFLNGGYTFSGGSSAAVRNDGTVNAVQGGYVAFIGNRISNNGSISTPGGMTALGAGSSVTLMLAGNDLLGFSVDGAALDALIENGGVIQADGGRVLLSAQAKDALLDTVVNNTGVIRAQTVQDVGGSIVLLGGDSGTTQVAGTLDASAPISGDGGFIETSGAHLKVADGTVITTKAANGNDGQWLIDPVDFTIAASGGDITGATLMIALGLGNVTIQTTDTVASCTGVTCGSGATGNGDIFVNDTVNWGANTLTLDAWRNIVVNREMNVTGDAGLVFKYGMGAVAAQNSSHDYVNAPINMAATTSFQAQQGSNGALNSYTIITNLAGLDNIRNDLAGHYVLGNDIAVVGNFTPIAQNTPAPSDRFTGTFNGLGHSLGSTSAVTVNDNGGKYLGLFGYVSNGAKIQNVTARVDIGGTDATWVGGLAGINYGTIVNSSTSGNVYGRGNVGGLVGGTLNSGAPWGIQRSFSTARVSSAVTDTPTSGNADYDKNFGGLAGYNIGTINGSYATGDVWAYPNPVPITNTIAPQNAGGLIGYNDAGGRVTDSYSTGDVFVDGPNAGGLIGLNQAQVTNSYTTGRVVIFGGNAANIGGFIGQYVSGTITNSYWDTSAYSSNTPQTFGSGSTTGVSSRSASQMLQQNTFSGWDFSGTWVIYNGYTNPLLRSFMVPLTVTADAVNPTYNGSAYSGGLINAEYSIAGANTSGHLYNLSTPYGNNAINAGTYASRLYSDQQGYIIDQSGVGALTIARANLTLSGSRVYNGSTVVSGSILTATGVNGETFSVAGPGAAGNLASANVQTGSTLASLTGLGLGTSGNGGLASNYNALSTANSSIDITRANLSLSGSRAYDGSTIVAGSILTATGVNGETFSVTGAGAAGNLANANVQTGSTLASLTDLTLGTSGNGGLASNYNTLSTANSSIDITRANLSLSGSRVYDGSTIVAGSILTATGVNGETFSVTGDGDASNLTGKDVQTGSTLASLTGLSLGTGSNGGMESNYNALSTANSSIDITRANLTLSGSRVYDGSTIVAGSILTATGVSGETFSVTGNGDASNLNSKNVQTGSTLASVAGLTLGTSSNGGLASNYNALSTADSAIDITPASLTVGGLTANNKIYDASTTATANTAAATYTGRINSDDVTLTSATGTFADKHVGTGKLVSLSAYTLDGDDAGNYTVSLPVGLTADITPATLTVDGLTASNKVYDGTTAATVNSGAASFADLIGSDDVNLTSISGVFADKHVGTGKAVTVSGYTLGGADADNYTLAPPTGLSADITQRAVTLTAPSLLKTFDGTTAYTTTTGDLNTLSANLIAGDSVTAATMRYADGNIGTGKTVSLDSASISDGNGGANYLVTLTGNSTSTIQPLDTDSATGPAAAMTESGYLVPNTGPSIQLSPKESYQLVNGTAKPMTVKLEVREGGVNAPPNLPGAACNGNSGIGVFAQPNPMNDLCGG